MAQHYRKQPYHHHKPHYKRPQHRRRGRQSTAQEFITTAVVVVAVGVFALAATASRETAYLLIGVLLLTGCVVLGLVLFNAYRRQQKMRAIQISGVDVMDGFVFEKYVEQLLHHQGYQNVRLTEKYDLGIDAIADRDGQRWGIQIKRNRGKTKAESVRQAVTALSHYKCTRAMVVSNSQFTGAARKLAESNDCVLIDRSKLGQWIADYQRGTTRVY